MRFAAAEFEIRLIVGADRGGGMREVRNCPQDRCRLRSASSVELGFGGGGLLAQAAAFGLAGLALGGILGLADRLADFVGLAIQFLDLGLLGFALGFERDEPRDVGLRAAAGAVLR